MSAMLSGLIDMLSIDFGRFLNSQLNAESASDALSSSNTPSSFLFKSSDFSDLYQGEDWNLDSLPVEEEEAAPAPSPPPAIFKSQEHIPKLFQSLDWDANVSSVDDAATAQAVAMQQSFEEAMAPRTPKPVPFADAFKSQDWTIGTVCNDVPIHPSMMDQTPTPESPKPAFKTAKNLFTSRDWLATEFLGTHEEVSISPAMFQLEDAPTAPTKTTTTTTTTTVPSFASAPAAAPEKTNWESMFIGQLQAQVAPASTISPPTPTTNKKRKRKKRPKVVPDHKTYVTISQHDVLLGRGGKSNHHPGNKRYREEVENFRPLYATLTTDEEKTSMSQALVDVLEQMGGRFLEEDKMKDADGKNQSLGWYVVPNIVARRKASQALREDSDPEKRKAKRARFLAKKKAMQGI